MAGNSTQRVRALYRRRDLVRRITSKTGRKASGETGGADGGGLPYTCTAKIDSTKPGRFCQVLYGEERAKKMRTKPRAQNHGSFVRCRRPRPELGRRDLEHRDSSTAAGAWSTGAKRDVYRIGVPMRSSRTLQERVTYDPRFVYCYAYDRKPRTKRYSSHTQTVARRQTADLPILQKELRPVYTRPDPPPVFGKTCAISRGGATSTRKSSPACTAAMVTADFAGLTVDTRTRSR